MATKTISKVIIEQESIGSFCKINHVIADDEKIFSYYPDELHFQSTEFIGLTVQEALQLRHEKDVAFLQS